MRILLLMLILCASPAQAQPKCAPFQTVLDTLAGQYQEYPAIMGSSKDYFMVILRNKETGSFTVISVDKTGRSCVLFTGYNWQVKPPHKDESGDTL